MAHWMPKVLLQGTEERNHISSLSTHANPNSVLGRILFLVQGRSEALLLPFPMTSFFVVGADLQSFPQAFALLDFGVRHLVYLVLFEVPPGPAIIAIGHFRRELLAQFITSLLYLLLVHSVTGQYVSTSACTRARPTLPLPADL